MKFRVILMTVLLAGPMVLYAQTNKDLIGIWKCDSQKIMRSMSTYSKSKYDSMSVQAKNSIESRIGKRSYNFSDPGVTIKFGNNGTAKQVSGDWSYSEDDMLLTITVNGQSKKYKVAWESKNQVQLIDHEAVNKSVLGVIYLNRSK